MPELSEHQFQNALTQACLAIELQLNENQKAQLHAYWSLFIKWNATYNLSAIRDPEQILYKHIVDSLAVIPHFKKAHFRRVLDVGTGGGLPGIPLAICFPDQQFTLIDSAGKKIRFLFQVKQALGLKNLSLENARVESLNVESFDIITSRAFASLKNFTSLTKNLIAENGEFWAMKGLSPNEELREIEKHYIVVEHLDLRVPGVEGQRCLIKLRTKHSE